MRFFAPNSIGLATLGFGLLAMSASVLFTNVACGGEQSSRHSDEDSTVTPAPQVLPEVVSVSASGDSGNYTFQVGIASEETGCTQYADWWEVVSVEDSSLLYRRILAHSHVDEQPFERSGGPVAIGADQQVFGRAHMNTLGYGNRVFQGSVASGFAAVTLDEGVAQELRTSEPLPESCAF